ncbi:MAG: hypothetical protein KKA35_00520, partial [Proteobacteria bacterium]|nr:hypothetical protein [Pseudomonadota bacterium]
MADKLVSSLVHKVKEPLSKRFSLVKVKAGENFNRRNTWSISRIKIFTQRRDWPKWDVLKLALKLKGERSDMHIGVYIKLHYWHTFAIL